MKEETTFRSLKKALLELLRGYPDYVFWGKIESYLKSGEKGVDYPDGAGFRNQYSQEGVED